MLYIFFIPLSQNDINTAITCRKIIQHVWIFHHILVAADKILIKQKTACKQVILKHFIFTVNFIQCFVL